MLLSGCIYSKSCKFRADGRHVIENFCEKKSEYDQEIPQSHTADQPKEPWGRVTERLQ